MADDPAYLRAFQDLAKAPLTPDDIRGIEKEFFGRNDRACGILFSGWAELGLESAIKSVLRSDISNGLVKALFDFDKPIGSFSAKIDVAYSLGVFG
jgi:hypothetical protein